MDHREMARRGGNATLKRHGKKFYSAIGRLGNMRRWGKKSRAVSRERGETRK